MRFVHNLSVYSIHHPKAMTLVMVAVTVVLALLALLPSVWPETFSRLHPVAVDTDPENMLSHDEAVRIFHNEMKELLNLHDMIVVGVVNEEHPEGVFTPETLGNIQELTEFALTLRGETIGQDDPNAGVVEIDVIAPSLVDNIEQGGLGVVRFDWLMPRPPESAKEALAVRDRAMNIPFLNGTMVSEDGQALALYLPITSKDLSYQIYQQLLGKIETLEGAEKYYITGLPVAEDTFGVEMFKQMAISAPMAMVVIFLLLLYFFRKLHLILSPMVVALVSVICTMGLLVISGNTIHIMSSMIPIFIMPIAVLDSVHILSDFFDRYQKSRNRKKTITEVMDHLSAPMLFTSLTSAAGFASLALTPIPPVQVFGIFISIGVLLAWLLTITFIPAFIMMLPEASFANFGVVKREGEAEEAPKGLTKAMLALGHFTQQRTKLILVAASLLLLLAVYGINQIQINDNPTRWFKSNHPIRVSDRVLNDHFGGTYMAYFALRSPVSELTVQEESAALHARLQEWQAAEPEDREALHTAVATFEAELETQTDAAADRIALLDSLTAYVEDQIDAAVADEDFYAWEDLGFFLDAERQQREIIKQPEVLRYLEDLQQALLETGAVGKSNSIADIVKTVHRELFEGDPAEMRIPDSTQAVAQTLMTYESSHRPHDLYHFVTPDYTETSIWVQLTSGDNKDMSQVVEAMDAYIAENPPPMGLEPDWFGLTYINVIWQERMVSGMLQAFMGSFLVVLLMMTLLFRSGLWGLISMIPLTLTIALIYGMIGLMGKDYDMPVAVLSSLTLGLAIDFAIHFLVRTRELYAIDGTWKKAYVHAFGEPARAIARNVIIIAVGFTPLLLAPLLPYVTVGFFLASILLISGLATLVLLPAIIKYLEPLLFPQTRACSILCQCGTCILTSVAAVALVAINIHQFLTIGWTWLTYISLVVLPILFVGCYLMSRREQCKNPSQGTD